jgi:hypothetical protein
MTLKRASERRENLQRKISMKIGLITDTHWGVRNDSFAMYDHFNMFYKNVFFPEIDRRGIKTVFHLGDIVERRKFINFVTLHEMRKGLIFPCLERGIDFHYSVGNHDIPFRHSNVINAVTELFGENYPNIHVYTDPTEVEFDGVKVLFVPWVHNANFHDSMELIVSTDAQILMGHLELKGFEMYRGTPNHEGLDASVFKDFDVVCSGHFHHKSTNGNINYLGSPYETTWHDFGDPRGFHIFDTETRELEFIENPHRLFFKLFYDDENRSMEESMDWDFEELKDKYVKVIVQNKTNPYWFDIAMQKLTDAKPADYKIVDDHQNLDDEAKEDIVSEAEDTLTILHAYVDRVKTQIDKKALTGLFSELYSEAQHLE